MIINWKSIYLTTLFFVVLQSAQCKYICDICDCNVSEIDCSKRNVSIVTEDLTLPENFKTLDLSDNDISELESTSFAFIPHSLESLDLSSNRFETITKDTFSQFQDLRVINLSNNLISIILENAFYNQSTLFELNLSFNQIKTLSETTFFYLRELKILDLSFNLLVKLDENLFRNLNLVHTLDLSFLRLEALHPITFDWNLTVKSLDVSHNFFRSVPTKSLWHLRTTLESLAISGNLIKKISDGDFMDLRQLKILTMEQWLYLKEIKDYAFKDLQSLESISLKYLPRMQHFRPKAFHTQHELVNVTSPLCPVHDFTLEFTTLTTLPEHLLDWQELRYLSLRNNRWNCNCKLIWMKNSAAIKKLTGNTVYCSYPFTNEGHLLKSLKDKDLTCSIFITNSKQGVGAAALILLIGIVVSFITVAALFHRKNGWLWNRPPPVSYDRLEPQPNVITIYERSEALEVADEITNNQLANVNLGIT